VVNTERKPVAVGGTVQRDGLAVTVRLPVRVEEVSVAKNVVATEEIRLTTRVAGSTARIAARVPPREKERAR